MVNLIFLTEIYINGSGVETIGIAFEFNHRCIRHDRFITDYAAALTIQFGK